MFMLVAAEQLRHLVRQRGRSPRPTDSPPAPAAIDSAPQPVPLHDPLALDAHPGTRYQLLRALRAMAAGESMLVEHKIPVRGHFDNSYRRNEWFRLLRKTASWQDQTDLEAVLVPGTAYPSVIGRILIRSGCCVPSEQPHWVPNLRFYFLNEVGRESFRRTQAWWHELTALERMRLMLLE